MSNTAGDQTPETAPPDVLPVDFDAVVDAAEAGAGDAGDGDADAAGGETVEATGETFIVEEEAAAGETDAAVDEPAAGDDTVTDEAASDAGRTLNKKKKSAQARIDEAIAKQRQAERDLQAAKDRAAELERALAEKTAGTTTTEEPPAAGTEAERAAAAAERAGEDSDPKDPRPVYDDSFDSYDDFIVALGRWGARREIHRDREARARVDADTAATRERDETLAAHQTRLVEARTRHADFDAVANNPDVQISRVMAAAMLTSKQSADVQYFLGKNPDVAAELATLTRFVEPTADSITEIQTVLESRMGGATSGPSPKPAPRTSAPKPIKPVGAASTASTVPLDSLDVDDYIDRRNADEDRNRRGR